MVPAVKNAGAEAPASWNRGNRVGAEREASARWFHLVSAMGTAEVGHGVRIGRRETRHGGFSFCPSQ